MMTYDEAVASIPPKVAELHAKAEKLRAQAARAAAKAEDLEDDHFAATRPVGCDTCAHAEFKGGAWTDRGWSAPCVSCRPRGRNRWEPRTPNKS